MSYQAAENENISNDSDMELDNFADDLDTPQEGPTERM